MSVWLSFVFRGEHVPQDPNDEPVSELLKRIQQTALAQNGTSHKKTADIIEFTISKKP